MKLILMLFCLAIARGSKKQSSERRLNEDYIEKLCVTLGLQNCTTADSKNLQDERDESILGEKDNKDISKVSANDTERRGAGAVAAEVIPIIIDGVKLVGEKLAEYLANTRPADKKPCPAGLRDDGVSCWKDSYGRGVGRIPDKTPCPAGLTDDGTSCWKHSYGRGAGRSPDKGDCPQGLRDDGTSCWSDAHVYGKGCCCTLWGCCSNCQSGYHDDGCTCRKVDVGIKVSLFERQSCRDDEERNGGLCYPKCTQGYRPVGCCVCEPVDGPGIKIPLAQRQTCKQDEELFGAMCYPKCNAGYQSVQCCICEPKEGPGIKVTLQARLYCNDDETLDAFGRCHPKKKPTT